MIKNNILILILLLIYGCSNTKEYVSTLTPILTSYENIKIEYYTENNKVKSILFFDFELNVATYLKKNINGVTICKGTFDINSFDSTKIYKDVITYVVIPRTGEFWIEKDEFNAMKSGLWKYYYSNNNVQMEGNYEFNKRIGKWSYFDPEGNLEFVRFYNMGEVYKDSIIVQGAFIPD